MKLQLLAAAWAVWAAITIPPTPPEDGYWMSYGWHKGNFNPQIVIDLSMASYGP